MANIVMHGYSDDIVYVSVDGDADEIGCYERPVTVDVLNVDGHGVRVTMRYGVSNATWSIGMEAIGGHEPQLPLWDFQFGRCGDCRYSMQLMIDTASESVTVKEVRDGQ